MSKFTNRKWLGIIIVVAMLAATMASAIPAFAQGSTVNVTVNGTTVIATASGFSPAYYQFWAENSKGIWNALEGYGTNSTCDLSSLPSGTYTVDTYASASPSGSNPVQGNEVTVTVANSSPVTVSGTTVTANTTSLDNLFYQFGVENTATGTWTNAQGYSSTASYSLANLPNGSYLVDVYALSMSDADQGNWGNYFKLGSSLPVTVGATAASISAISATNGTITVTLSSTPATTPAISDFAVTQAINGGTATAVTPTAISTSGNVVTLTVPTVPATGVSQSVVDSVSYQGGTPVSAAAFTIPSNVGAVTSINATVSNAIPNIAPYNDVVMLGTPADSGDGYRHQRQSGPRAVGDLHDHWY
jgi:hypothetical protein